jgi:hypothetical protein
MPRVLRLAGRVELPQFFDIDDTLPPDPPTSQPAGPGNVTSPPDQTGNAEDRS